MIHGLREREWGNGLRAGGEERRVSQGDEGGIPRLSKYPF